MNTVTSSSGEDVTLKLRMDNNPKFGSNLSFPVILTHKNTDIVSGFSSFCDCCIVLTYDPARGTCYDGQLSWAAPYL